MEWDDGIDAHDDMRDYEKLLFILLIFIITLIDIYFTAVAQEEIYLLSCKKKSTFSFVREVCPALGVE